MCIRDSAGSGGQGGQSAASDAGGRHAPVRNYRTQHRLQGIWKMMSSQNAEPPEGLLLKVVRREQGKVFRLTMQGAVEALLEVTPRFNESEIFLMAANERDSIFYGLEGHDQRRYDRERRALRRRHLWEAQDVLTHLDAGLDSLVLFDPGTDSDSDSGSEPQAQRAARPTVDPQAHVRHACERDEPGRTGAQHAYAHGATAGSDFHRARDTANG